MAERPFTQADLDVLAKWDTPTICNGLEIIARSAARSVHGGADGRVDPQGEADRRPRARRHDPREGGAARVGHGAGGVVRLRRGHRPADHRGDPGYRRAVGYGAFWGEVQSTVHKALGSIGCVTNGSFRDLDMWAQGFQMIGGRVGPSHAHVHMVAFGQPVNVFGMQVGHDDVVHADFHGAVVIPADA